MKEFVTMLENTVDALFLEDNVPNRKDPIGPLTMKTTVRRRIKRNEFFTVITKILVDLFNVKSIFPLSYEIMKKTMVKAVRKRC